MLPLNTSFVYNIFSSGGVRYDQHDDGIYQNGMMHDTHEVHMEEIKVYFHFSAPGGDIAQSVSLVLQ